MNSLTSSPCDFSAEELNAGDHQPGLGAFEGLFEVLKQGLNRASLCQLLPVQPYRLGIGDFVLKP